MALYNNVRPHTFSEVVGQENIVKNLSMQSKSDKFFQTYILSGQYGTGKTTIARILAMSINCKHKDEGGNPCLVCDECKSILDGSAVDVIEVDGASNTGVDKVREIIAGASYEPVSLKKKVYIIDEVHMLSTSAFNALLKTLEEPAPTVTFILCTTELRKIPETVISRSACYVFKRIDRALIVSHLLEVAQKNGITVNNEGVSLIARRCDGSMRNALSILEQVSAVGEVNEDNVSSLLHIPCKADILRILTSVVSGDSASLAKEEVTPAIVDEMISIVSDAMLHKLGALKDSEVYFEELSSLSGCNTETLVKLSDTLNSIKNMLRSGFGESAILIELIKFSEKESLNERVLKLEKELEDIKNGLVSIKPVSVAVEEVATDEAEGFVLSDETVPFDDVSSGIGEDADDLEEVVEPTIEREEVKEEEKEEIKPSDDFNFSSDFNLFFDFPIESTPALASGGTVGGVETESNEIAESVDTAESAMLKSESVLEDSVPSNAEIRLAELSNCDVIFSEALKGCKKSVDDGIVVLTTPLEPIYDIIVCYIEVHSVTGVKVVLDTGLLF